MWKDPIVEEIRGIRTSYIAAMIMVCLAPLANGTKPTTKQLPGLSVQGDVLVLRGKPYYGIGANYFSLFSRTLKNPSDISYQRELERLSKSGIPFVRFMASGFWPIDWDLYLSDKDAYFKLLDGVVKSAEKNEIGLIPSLFWNMSTVPDIVGEPMAQFGNVDSKTIAFIRQYTREVVMRYKSSPSIWGWEFGNEYNLHVDLPNASEHRPPVWPALKTPLKRTERDDLSSTAMLTTFAEFAKTVRKHDKHRILITGNSVPRPSAYHNSKEKSWKRDSIEQFGEILLRDTPDAFNTTCVHVYPRIGDDYSARAKNLTDLVKTIQGLSSRAKKPLFIGEFGTPRTLGKNKERAKFLELVNAIEANKVPLSAFWVFDHAGQNKDWNVTFDNERRYMLKLVGEANQRMKTNPKGN